MKKINFLDPSIERKKKLTDDNFQFIKNTNYPLPSEVEISESGICNRKCSFCPRSAPDFKDVKEFITPKLHSKLINDLKEQSYKGVVRYSGFVEPLLDKNIFNLIHEVKTKLPEARSELVTNGDVLNKTRLKKLFKSGLTTILISVYDGPEDATKFDNLCKEADLNSDQFVIRHRYYSEDKDFGITISNRAGMMEKAEYKIKSLDKALNEKCFYPSYTFFMDYNGDVLMCPHDWGKKIILGNMNNSTFLEIWTSKKAIKIREQLSRANRNFSPCNVCDVAGSLIGEKHSKSW
ncbi:SPASM domain-containing protein [Candidatus Pelagibacter bacterium]|nr:SPASM domain-containing protein [Candidatus Pelagibacter bacterium]